MAIFRHTIFHRRMKLDFFERRDAMHVLHSRLVAYSSLLSHPRTSFRYAVDYIGEIRESLAKVSFPYIRQKPANKKHYENEYDEYFDELDKLDKMEKGRKSSAGDGVQVGDEGRK